jgi:hypothetical protein
VLLFAGVVQADPLFGPAEDSGAGKNGVNAERWRPGFGARIGGYGFRNHDGSGAWNDCRMNGAGIFGTVDYGRHVYGELSFDGYQATPDTMSEGVDRISWHGTAGVGLRMLPDFVVTPFVEAGGGVEWTRLSVGEARTEGAFPVGYFGLGAALHVTRQIELGAGLRSLATAQEREEEETAATAGAGLGAARQALTSSEPSAPEMQLGVAAQGLFFLRYSP